MLIYVYSGSFVGHTNFIASTVHTIKYVVIVMFSASKERRQKY